MTQPLQIRPHAVFFDLDGTLADTAADLAAPVNAMRVERGLEPLPLDALRPFASMGARGLIGRGLGIVREDPAFEALRIEFLERYEAGMVVHTRLFDGVPELLDALDAAGLRWGVVSNKVERYVRPILAALGVLERSVTAIGGDTTPFAKPHPEPLLHAAHLAGVDAAGCVYVGDDLRDVEAGRAAGMRTIAAAYGYCGDEGRPPGTWGADALVGHPSELAALLRVGRDRPMPGPGVL
ncbi:MAG: phosphoglycolate phosphatase [Burkholderiales bacterium]|nr:MAG: phosphoglycolate phosphatase [Burkholderiales bacterium]